MSSSKLTTRTDALWPRILPNVKASLRSGIRHWRAPPRTRGSWDRCHPWDVLALPNFSLYSTTKLSYCISSLATLTRTLTDHYADRRAEKQCRDAYYNQQKLSRDRPRTARLRIAVRGGFPRQVIFTTHHITSSSWFNKRSRDSRQACAFSKQWRSAKRRLDKGERLEQQMLKQNGKPATLQPRRAGWIQAAGVFPRGVGRRQGETIQRQGKGNRNPLG